MVDGVDGGGWWGGWFGGGWSWGGIAKYATLCGEHMKRVELLVKKTDETVV